MKPLTKMQEKVLAFLREFADENGYPPTRAEIALHFKWSSANAGQGHLEKLEQKGCISITPGVARGIKVLS